CAREGYGMDSW
nr:immunoglobulin heavy chain junction region [Macaca mulatta]MPO14379.1 immunoglobulin heavy chain junction region [Macaca mulatta]MPO14381.1 immunoglobulin heavy chain junction region [Macaca mulatta]MPO14383.1 immunoglobulin heavy chain junction region [Macaca mulatta]MPO14384.1 immunoglobulin heavy chain junction region [Macaca mulatta]